MSTPVTRNPFTGLPYASKFPGFAGMTQPDRRASDEYALRDIDVLESRYRETDRPASMFGLTQGGARSHPLAGLTLPLPAFVRRSREVREAWHDTHTQLADYVETKPVAMPTKPRPSLTPQLASLDHDAPAWYTGPAAVLCLLMGLLFCAVGLGFVGKPLLCVGGFFAVLWLAQS